MIAFTDDDTVPDADWLRQGLLAMGGPPRGQRPRASCRPPACRPTTPGTPRGLETAEFVTANAFVRRPALEHVGGFDERFTRAWREDSDLQFSLLSRCGGSIGTAPAAVVVHPVREAPWGISLRQQANVYFDALLFKKHPELYRRKIRNRPPWRYLTIVGCTVAALACLLAGARRAALLLGLVVLLAIADIARRRLRDTSHAPRHVAEMLLTSVAIPYLAMFWRLAGAWRFRTLFP